MSATQKAVEASVTRSTVEMRQITVRLPRYGGWAIVLFRAKES